MKDKYSLLNNVEVDCSKYKIEEVSESQKSKMMKKFIGSKKKDSILSKNKFIAAIVALILVVNVGINGDRVLATATKLKRDINTWLGIKNTGEKYSNQMHKSLKFKNIKLDLNEFFIDDSRIIINLNINKGVNKAYKNHRNLIPYVYVNGKKVETNSNYVGVSVVQINQNSKESNMILEVNTKHVCLNNKDNIKLVFSNLSKECGVCDKYFTYRFVYDSTKYKNASKIIKINKSIAIGENKLYLSNVIVTPDRIFILGFSKGFSTWKPNGNTKYYYDVVDQNNELVPLKEDIGNRAFFYTNGKKISTLKIIPYTFKKINTRSVDVLEDGTTRYVIEDKIITLNLK